MALVKISRSAEKTAERKAKGRRFRAWLEANGYSANSFAKEVNLSPDRVRDWAAGRRWNDMAELLMQHADEKRKSNEA